MLNRLQTVFESLQSHDVEYVVIGGIAAVLHGVPRATFDLGILIRPTLSNVNRLLDALRAVGFGTADLIDAAGILHNEITVFNDRVRIDVQTATPGIVFQEAWSRRETMEYGGQPFFVLCRADLIASKKATGQTRDLEDVRVLELPDQQWRRVPPVAAVPAAGATHNGSGGSLKGGNAVLNYSRPVIASGASSRPSCSYFSRYLAYSAF